MKKSMCACVLCGAAKKEKKRLSMPPAVCVRGAFSMGSRWEDAEMWDGKKEEKKKLLIIARVQ